MFITDEQITRMLSTLRERFNQGKLRLYTGPRLPVWGGPIGANNVLIAEFSLSATPFRLDAGDTMYSANAVSPVVALATGTIMFARALEADGTTVIGDLHVSDEDSFSELRVNSQSVVQGQTVRLTGFRSSTPFLRA